MSTYTNPEFVGEDDEHIVYDIGVELPPEDRETHKVYRSIVTRFLYEKATGKVLCSTTYEVEGGHTAIATSNSLTLPVALWEQITGHKLQTNPKL